MSDSRSRLLSVVRQAAPVGQAEEAPVGGPLLEPGLANAVTLQRRKAAEVSEGDEESFFLDTLAEYQWARDAAGLAATTLDRLTRPVLEICEHYGLAPWRLTPRQVDQYFAGPGKRARSTVRQKMNIIDSYFAFLEQRYAGEIARRYGVAVESPVDAFNRPRHRGDFGLRVPPSQRATREFFGRWRDSLDQARKPLIARRDYVMGKITYISGVRAAELCGVRIGDLHWESGQWGRFLVNGKGARGSGPRPAGGLHVRGGPGPAVVVDRGRPRRLRRRPRAPGRTAVPLRAHPGRGVGAERHGPGHRGDAVDVPAGAEGRRGPVPDRPGPRTCTPTC